MKQCRSQVKRYMYCCIFTCLVLRAVHIEVLNSMDTKSFINACERFVARRGRPEVIWSDGGSSFIGAQRELKEAIRQWTQEAIHEHLLQKEKQWITLRRVMGTHDQDCSQKTSQST